MRIENDVKLDFCDVLIRPKRSEASSRANVDVTQQYKFKGLQEPWAGVPIMAANMDTTGTFQMARALAEFDMQTCLHKHYPVEQLIHFFNKATDAIERNCFYTLGITDHDFAKFEKVFQSTSSIRNVCIDVANGYSAYFVDWVKRFIDKYPTLLIMAGNVTTPEMVQELVMSGVHIVKVGIGGGSVCTTRIIAGVGYPQLSAIIECADAAHGLGGFICADGGCTTPGEVAKAFGGGADFVMLGKMFSGVDECEGEWIDKEDGRYLKFYGMSSKEAMNLYCGGVAPHRAAEGKCTLVKGKGPVSEVAKEILGGLRSACSYVGAMRLKDLSKCTTFVRVNRTHNTIFGS